MPIPRQNAFTAIEVLIALTFIALLSAVAIPAWQQHLAAQRLLQTTEHLVQDLRSARTLALTNNTAYFIHFDTAANHINATADWCSVMSAGPGCHCLGENSLPACAVTPDRRLHWQQASDFPGISLTEAVFGSHNEIRFNPVRGTASFGHIDLQDDYNHQLKITISMVGRIRICSPPDAILLPPYPSC